MTKAEFKALVEKLAQEMWMEVEREIDTSDEFKRGVKEGIDIMEAALTAAMDAV